MAGHGGSRSGAGRPKGGLSQTRRLLEGAITEGLAHAGRSRYAQHMTETDTEEDARRTAAMIVSDMIQAGEGKEVMKLWVQVSTGEKNGQGNGGSATLADALSALPSLPDGANVPQSTTPEEENATISGDYIERATDNGFVAPQNGTFFTPQQGLLVDLPALDHEQIMGGEQPADGTPHPPLAQPGISTSPDTKNFENSESDSDSGDACPDADERFG